MNNANPSITADAIAIQEKDSFRDLGWLKVISPAKVNLHLAIGSRRPDGYHDATTVMHAINLHDIVYARRIMPGQGSGKDPIVRMVACGDVAVPDISSEQNIASKAIKALAEETRQPNAAIELRIEKNIPAEGGLGGGSSNAAAALLAAARLWGIPESNPAIEKVARRLGSDVAFFLHGGCSVYEGTGEIFVRNLASSKRAIALIKPEKGVSTAEAYTTFDANPAEIPSKIAAGIESATAADEIALFNNLAPASESILPELGGIRAWLNEQPGVEGSLLCGSGATTFAVCESFSAACSVVAAAKTQGYWARATSFGSLKATIVS